MFFMDICGGFEDMEAMKLMCVSKINVQWYPDGLQLGEWEEESQKKKIYEDNIFCPMYGML